MSSLMTDFGFDTRKNLRSRFVDFWSDQNTWTNAGELQ